MKSRLDDLIQKAQLAQPPGRLARSSWTPYLPIIRILMEQRAHSLAAAVDWLVAQEEIPAKRRGQACGALRQILARREEKRLRLMARARQAAGGRKPRKPSTRDAATA